MRDQTNFLANRYSRRRLLALAGGASAVAVPGPGSLAARQDATATPVAQAPTIADIPMPGTMAVDASPLFRTATEALVAAMEQTLVPGAAIGLLAGDREEHAAFGVASLSSLSPVTPETLFQIGSITKTFTATAVWRLIDAGALDLDAPLRTYIPEITLMDADAADWVTVGNLLDHTAGWYGDEGFSTGDDDDALARYVAERLPQLPQLFSPGAYFSYNNAAFTVLGRLIEIATGTTYNAAMQSLLIGPLGLNDSLLDHDEVRQRPYADGHVALPINGRLSLAVQTPLWLPRSVDPAGGIWSTTRDVLRYAQFHMNPATPAGLATVVDPESLVRMREPAVDIPGTSLQMGRDWFVQDVDGVRAAYHGGDTLGQHADLVMFPDHDVALVVLTNGQGGGSRAAAAALDAILAGVPGLAPLVGKIGLLPALLAPADAPTVDLSSTLMSEYEGRYADLGQAYTLTRTDAGLDLSVETIEQPGALLPAIDPPSSPTTPVAFLDTDMGVASQQRLPFVRNADGRVGWIATGLRLLPRVDEDA